MCKSRFQHHFNFFLLVLVIFSLGAGIGFLPLFNNKFNSYFIESENDLVVVGDPVIEPYIWDNLTTNTGFGNPSIKFVNFSYFRQLFNQNTFWRLEYKRYDYSDWTNGNQYMSIDKSWNDSLSGWKFNLSFNNPLAENVYQARFVFACNLSVLQYVNVSNELIFINYTLSNGDIYHCYFNYSDLMAIPGLYFKRGVTDNKMWFLFGRYNIPPGLHSFDPIFGNNDVSGWSTTLMSPNYYRGTAGTPSSSGTADNITFYIYELWTAGEEVKCGLYNSDGSFFASTEERTDGGSGFFVFNFSDPKPSIVADTKYYVTAYVDDQIRIHYKSGGDRVSGTGTYPTWESPADNTGGAYTYRIYCSYTESGGEPDWLNVTRGWITAKNTTSLKTSNFGYATSKNTTSLITSNFGYVTSKNTTSLVTSNFGYITSKNSTNLITSNFGYVTSKNTTSLKTTNFGWVNASNSSIVTWFTSNFGYVTSKNTTSLKTTNFGWITAQNATVETWQTSNFGYITCENSSIPDNLPPEITPNPGNNSENISITLGEILATITDPDGDLMNITIELDEGNMSFWFNRINGTFFFPVDYSFILLNNLYGNNIKWWVNVSDGTTTNSSWFIYSTVDDPMDVEVTFNANLLMLAVSIFFFVLFFIIGYKSEKKSGGIFLMVSGFMLISCEALLVPYLAVLSIVFLSPVAIIIITMGVYRTFYRKTTKDE